MLNQTAPDVESLRNLRMRRVVVKATRPAIVDLRFREDAWIVGGGSQANVCLGDYALTALAVTDLDLPALNRLFGTVRVGQARRHQAQRNRVVQ